MAGIAFAGRGLKHITALIRTSTTTTARRISTLPPIPTPWLRVPSDIIPSGYLAPHNINFENFFNIVDKRLLKLERWNLCGTDCYNLSVGSSRGSLAVVNIGKICIKNIHSGGGTAYELDTSNHDHPSLIRFYTKVGDHETFLCYPRYHPQNPTPKDYHDFYVPRSYDYNYQRPDDYTDERPDDDDYTVESTWIRYPNLFHKDDPPIVYCQKSKTVYKLSCHGNEYGPWVVELWDISDNRINVTSRINVAHDSNYEFETFEMELRARCHQDRYLVLTGDEGGRGDPVLYLVVRHHNRELGVSQTRAIDVFRFDLVGEKMSYTKKLDDHAFFIGQGSDSFAVPVEQCGPGGLKSNSIYIADDLRVFDLKDGSIIPILDMGDLSMTPFKSLWIPPPTHEQIENGKKWRNHFL